MSCSNWQRQNLFIFIVKYPIIKWEEILDYHSSQSWVQRWFQPLLQENSQVILVDPFCVCDSNSPFLTTGSDVIEAENQNFQKKVIDNGSLTLVSFYAPWLAITLSSVHLKLRQWGMALLLLVEYKLVVFMKVWLLSKTCARLEAGCHKVEVNRNQCRGCECSRPSGDSIFI